VKSARAIAGFTLIEILAVIVILGILTTVLITQLAGGRRAAEVEATRRLLARLEVAIDQYEREFGDFPPSSFAPDQVVSNDGTNVGGEALVVALWSNGWEAGGLLAGVADTLVNVDGDRSASPLTDFDSSGLFEIPDAWCNPVAYFHRREYARRDREYRTIDPSTGDELTSYPAAFKNAATGRYMRNMRYQLISAGLDGSFGTDDDVTTFER